jgi:hypothetical protein
MVSAIPVVTEPDPPRLVEAQSLCLTPVFNNVLIRAKRIAKISPLILTPELNYVTMRVQLPLRTVTVASLQLTINTSNIRFSRGSVSLSLPLDGANNSTAVTDYSPNPKTITVYGNARISTAQSQWGGSSLLSSGGGDALQATSSDFAFGTGIGTVEFWLRPILSNATNFGRIIQVGDFPLNGAWQLVRDAATNPMRLLLDLTDSGNSALRLQPSTTLSSSAFTHVAIVFNRPTVSIYIAGTLAASGSYNYSLTRTDLSIFNNAGRNNGLDAYMDDLRIIRGIVLYKTNFTVPSGPLSAQF